MVWKPLSGIQPPKLPPNMTSNPNISINLWFISASEMIRATMKISYCNCYVCLSPTFCLVLLQNMFFKLQEVLAGQCKKVTGITTKQMVNQQLTTGHSLPFCLIPKQCVNCLLAVSSRLAFLCCTTSLTEFLKQL